MYYYDPDNKNPRRWAMIAAGAYALLFAVSFAVVSFDFAPAPDKPGDTILVDFTEPPAPEPPRPPVKTADEPRVHDVAAPEERTAQVAGKDEVTQTPNPKALFRMNKGGADEPDNAGNPAQRPEGSPEDTPQEYLPEVENMEGAAFFAVCDALGVACCQIRAVSNYVGEPFGQWAVEEAVGNLTEKLNQIFESNE